MNLLALARVRRFVCPQSTTMAQLGLDLGDHLSAGILGAMPKVDLHRHLTGAIRVSTLRQIVDDYDVELPPRVKEHFENYVIRRHPARSLRGFLWGWWIFDKIMLQKSVIREKFADIVSEILEDAATDNVRYVELRMSPYGVMNGVEIRLGELLELIEGSVREARAKLGIEARLILSLTRQYLGSSGLSEARRRKYYDALLDGAKAFKEKLVVGFDLTGLEDEAYPPSRFEGFFRAAKEEGFKITVHAGEHRGPELMWEAIDILGADRIGHGIAAVSDPRLMEALARRRIALEVCPTSNYLSRAVRSVEDHPIRRLHKAGVAVTVNTDNPVVCDVTLTREYELLMQKCHFEPAELWGMNCVALGAAFLPDDARREVRVSVVEPWRSGQRAQAESGRSVV